MTIQCKQCKTIYPTQKDGFYKDVQMNYYQPCKKCVCDNRKKKRQEKKKDLIN